MKLDNFSLLLNIISCVVAIWRLKWLLNDDRTATKHTLNWKFPNCSHMISLLNKKQKLNEVYLVWKFYIMTQGHMAALGVWPAKNPPPPPSPPPKKNEIFLHIVIWHQFRMGMLSFTNTAWKVSKYGVISGPYFPFVNLCIQSDYRKIRTRSNPVFGHFSRSESLSSFKASYHNCGSYGHKIGV